MEVGSEQIYKWIKTTPTIKLFFGTSENAVKDTGLE